MKKLAIDDDQLGAAERITVMVICLEHLFESGKDKMKQKLVISSFICCIILMPFLDARKFGGGGGGGRGSSGARANPPPAGGGHFGGGGAPVGGGQPHFGAGGGGFHPQPAGGFRGPPMSSGAGPGRFGSGTGLGSSNRAGTFTTALAGAAVGTVGGLVAFEAGKAIIRSFDQPFHHEGRDYYLDEQYAKKRAGEIQCKMPWDTLIKPSTASNASTNATSEQTLANATFPNGSRPKEVVWTCKDRVEICCGMDCCPNPQFQQNNSNSNAQSGMSTFSKVLLGILVVGLLSCCCCAFLTYKFCRTAFDSCVPGNNNNNTNHYDQDQSKYDVAGDHAQHGQAYPMQPYYPSTANSYPAQPQPPAVYPPAPAPYPQAPAYYDNKY
uniref:CX domain-containing protein n=1 Tax=Globodera rostochiensis TaxID=31243 RepID=A0A914HG64_GLORO